MTIIQPTAGANPWNQNALYDVVNGVGGTEITSQIDSRITPIVGRNQRTTDSPTFNATRVAILSTRAPVRNGRTYTVIGYGEVLDSHPTTPQIVSQHEIRITTNDTEPTTSSTQIARALVNHPFTFTAPVACVFMGRFVCTADGFLRALICSFTAVGSNVGNWSAASDRPMMLDIIDEGPTVSTSGTVY